MTLPVVSVSGGVTSGLSTSRSSPSPVRPSVGVQVSLSTDLKFTEESPLHRLGTVDPGQSIAISD